MASRKKTSDSPDIVAGLVLATVILVAIGGIYILYKGPGQAVAQGPTTVDIGTCACQSDNVFTVPATVLEDNPGIEQSCQAECAAHNAVSLGPVSPSL